MRLVFCLGILGLAGCAVNEGINPNYLIGGNSPYDKYRQAREVALKTGKDAPAVIPITLPAKAPTAAQIAGARAMQSVATDYRTEVDAQAEARAVARAEAQLPTTTSGPYPGSTPVLVRYAFAARHPVGQAVWPRTGGSEAAAAKFCASYSDPSRAQTAFLAAGGPDRDPAGVDPDGDGFVCGWDPAPYRVEQL